MKTEYCKLTDSNRETANHTKWGEGVTHTAAGTGRQLCTDGVIHVYDNPLKAVLFNPIHANIQHPVLWEVQVEGVVADDGTKVGVKTCTTVRRIPLPVISPTQRVRIAIHCALEVYHEAGFVKWAHGWLSGENMAARAA